MGTIARDLNEIKFFVQVAESQNFTLAGQRLGVPKSTVSRAIQRLEQRLGIQLVERTTRRVALTEAGSVYLERCVRVMEEAEQADMAVGALLARPRGRLRVGAPSIFATAVLGPILGDFLDQYPEVQLSLQMFAGSVSIRDRNLDLMICAGPLEDSDLIVRPLMRIRLGVYASPSYLLGREVPDSPAALRQHSCITKTCAPMSEPADSAVWRLRRGSELREVKVESRVSVADPAIGHRLALAGIGVSLLSQSAAELDVQQGTLVRLMPDWEPEPVELYAVYRSRLAASPKVRAFLQFMQDRFTNDSIVRLEPAAKRNLQQESEKSVAAH